VSGAGYAEDAPDNVQTEGGTRPLDHQQRDLREMHRITYTLGVEQDRKSVSIGTSNLRKMHQITYELMMDQGRGRSAVGFAEDAPDYVQAEGGTRQQERQQWDLWKMHQITYLLSVVQGRKCQQQDLRKMCQITYFLRVEQGHESISSGVCGRCTRSHTD
jgi:hypothetical protein